MPKINSLKNFAVRNKRALVRVDFDVPMDEKGKIIDNFRIKESLPTIKYLIKQKCRVVLISHLGRPEGRAVKKFSLRPVAEILSKFLKKEVLFASDPKKMKPGDILLLENIRFDKREERNSLQLSQELAKLGDAYINEAFAVSHRKHASIVGIPKLLPSAAGFLLEKEIRELSKILENPERPLVTIIGGAKISTKIEVISRFLKIADKVLIGGALANTILASQGVSMGDSIIEKEAFGKIRKFNLKNSKLFLPIDLAVWDEKSARYCEIDGVKDNEKVLDVGPKTIDLFCNIISEAKTIVWNGPMGLIEQKPFDKATRELIDCIAESKTCSVVGGGDTVALIRKIKKEKVFDWVSTGGGAMLDYLASGTLPGIEALKNE